MTQNRTWESCKKWEITPAKTRYHSRVVLSHGAHRQIKDGLSSPVLPVLMGIRTTLNCATSYFLEGKLI